MVVDVFDVMRVPDENDTPRKNGSSSNSMISTAVIRAYARKSHTCATNCSRYSLLNLVAVTVALVDLTLAASSTRFRSFC